MKLAIFITSVAATWFCISVGTLLLHSQKEYTGVEYHHQVKPIHKVLHESRLKTLLSHKIN